MWLDGGTCVRMYRIDIPLAFKHITICVGTMLLVYLLIKR